MATNYCTNPSFETGAADALATGFSLVDSTVTGTVVFSKVAGRNGGLAQRIQYTGVEGDAAGNLAFYIRFPTSAGTVTPGDVWTQSLYVKAACTGVSLYLTSQYVTDAGGWLESGPNLAIANSATFLPYSQTTGAAPATSGVFRLLVFPALIGTGDIVDFTIDDVLIEKSAVLTPYFDGSYWRCAWDGVAHASTSQNELAWMSGRKMW